MARRHALYSMTFFFCAPFLVLSTFVFTMSPLGLGFSDATAKLQSPLVFGIYLLVYLAGIATIFGVLPVSIACSTQDSSRRLGFQLLVASAALLVPLQLILLIWLSS